MADFSFATPIFFLNHPIKAQGVFPFTAMNNIMETFSTPGVFLALKALTGPKDLMAIS